MTRHIGAEALARYREGDLGSRKSARIRAHLAGCARCMAMDHDLAGVTALLASAPAPAMPDQVTTRIQAALTVEAARMAEAQVTGAGGAGHQPGRPRRPAGTARARQSRHAAGRDSARRLRLPELRSALARRALGTAAVAAVIAGGIYGFAQLAPSGQSNSTASGSSGAARLGEGVTAGPNSPVLHYRSGGQLATFTPFSTGTNFQRQRLASQVSSELRSSKRSLPTSGKMNANTSPQAEPAQAGASLQHGPSFGGIAVKNLQGCVTRIAAGATVRLVDVARYQGKRATIIVVAGGAGGAGGTRVFVVGPGCSASRSDLIAQTSLPGAG